MKRRPPRTTQSRSSAASDVYKRQEQLRPSREITVKQATRYGSTPAWKNTFTNIQPQQVSAMYMDEKERFQKDPLARIAFQKEEKAKKQTFNDNKLKTMQMHNNFFASKISEQEVICLLYTSPSPRDS
eukprot:TRINITY_DN16743_c0_g1_i2.p2 TRINITY_DN16743_c0_g1~~TRINITY_DN16743_c0_g1_i2.p2  ORF type:complete len:128 (+),score=41.14 TRINITY_DN16743_c0_g1_i2:2-385(+)